MAARSTAIILDVASASAGVCTRAELRRAGLADRTITDQAKAGRLVRMGPGVYEVPDLVTSETPFYRAARAHPRGALSHHSAARLWGFPVAPAQPGDPIEITVTRGAGVRATLAGTVVHATRRWLDGDVVEVRPGLPATGQARTIVDLAGAALTDRRLRHVVQNQVVAGGVTFGEVAACLARVGARGVDGAGRLRRLLADLDDDQPVAESALERRLASLLDRRFRRQYRPPWYDGVRGIVDFADPQSRVIVEADGRRWHATGQAMTEDRRRDRRAATHGWLVLRVTWDDLADRPESTAAEISRAVIGRDRMAA